jgi:type IV pilus assembly protein PilA
MSKRIRAGAARRGFSLIELLIVMAIILIIITMAVPQYNKVMMHTRETAALEAIGTIHKMETMYQSQYRRYAKTLQELGPPANGVDSGPAAAGLIGNDLASGENNGYKFKVSERPGGYSVTATPIAYGSSGMTSYYSDETMVIREFHGKGDATESSPEMGTAQDQK